MLSLRQPPAQTRSALSSLPSFLLPHGLAGHRHFGRRRLLSMTDFGSPPLLIQERACGESPQNPMTATLGCAGLSASFTPAIGGNPDGKRLNMTTSQANAVRHGHRPESGPARDPMHEFANRIVAELERGVKPWVRPWVPEKAGGPQAPFNPVTGRRYHGINVLILGMDMRAFETGDPRWMTYQQAQERRWQVRKGERATTIFFTKSYEVEDQAAEDETKTVRVLRHYSVFHASQIDGIPAYKAPAVDEAPWARPEAADVILRNSGAVIRIGGDRAFYSPSTDHIQLPPEHAFNGPAEFAAVSLHELAHWTGHESRLNRNLQVRYGSAAYAMEELRAELASAFVANEIGIPTDIPHHASYIANWIKPLKDDKREIFRAAADAQRIADMELGFHPDYVAQAHAEFAEAPVCPI
jgi:antirestriction protein ArdC